MLRLRRPIVIVDEAHNARTDLSFATLGNLLPSCIIEFTATPATTKHPSNVLHRVSAAELKSADMVKLPLRVFTRDPSQREQLLSEALSLRADLEKLAAIEGQNTGEYLRPILLIQAVRVDDVGAKGTVEGATVARDEAEDFIATLHQQTLQLGGESHWSLEALVAWIDARIPHDDIPKGESAEFLRKVIRGLMAQRGCRSGVPPLAKRQDAASTSLDVDTIALDRFRLRDEVEELIQAHRIHERETAFKNWLLPESALSVSDACALNFKSSSYDPSWLYEGGHQFKKNYFGQKPGELREKKSDGKLTEEFQCACYLDELPAVRWWVRNLSQKSSSFRLQTSKQWFYPDFICQLADGRIMAVEYKGKHLWNDAEEKRAVGAVWQSRSKGRCVFVMPTDGDFGVIEETCLSGVRK